MKRWCEFPMSPETVSFFSRLDLVGKFVAWYDFPICVELTANQVEQAAAEGLTFRVAS